MKFLKITTIFFLILATYSCQRDDSPSELNSSQNNNRDPFLENFGSEVSRTFIGRITNTQNWPERNIIVSIGNSTALTDGNGVFIIKDALVRENFAYVKAKIGWQTISKSIVPTIGVNYIDLKINHNLNYNNTSSPPWISGEILDFSTENASVTLYGDYINTNGTSYSGSMSALFQFLDPTEESFQDFMPGMLLGKNLQGEPQALKSYGMINVQIFDDNNNELDIAQGSTAEISMKVDQSILASAPATIPMWYFDEDKGYWIEEGEATLVGDTYMANVEHFTWWNCDIPQNMSRLCVTTEDSSNNQYSNLSASLTSSNFGVATTTTNNDGEFCGFIPNNEIFELEIKTNDGCLIYEETIGPFNNDTDLTITIDPNTSNFSIETITGNLTNCDGEPVSNGYVEFTQDEYNTFNYVSEGSFIINTVSCTNSTNSFLIEGFDFDTLETTESIEFTYSSPETNIGTLSTCESSALYLFYQIDNEPTVNLNPNYCHSLIGFNSSNRLNILRDGKFLIRIDLDLQNPEITYNITNSTEPFEGNYFSILLDALDWQNGNSEITNLNLDVNILQFGDVDEIVKSTFSGTFTDDEGVNHTITGASRLLRSE